MKNILTILIFVLATYVSYAQVDTISTKDIDTALINRRIEELKKQGHFTFKDIPIDGSLNQFVTKLKKQGFIVLKTTTLDAILKGKFTGEDVYLFVQASSDKVYGVTVSYKKQTTWDAVKTQYNDMKYMLTAKYSDPIDTTEKFNSPYYDGCGVELYALSEDECTFMTNFATKTGNGMIRLKISSDASVVINYVDTINFLYVSNKASNDL